MKAPKITNLGYSNLWTDMSTILGYSSNSNFDHPIQKLFSNGEQGFWYDPNDLTTMFQDAAGTIPVTGARQPVGLILDKSGRNNHARQSNSSRRPILRQTPILGNELVINGDFSNGATGWTSGRSAILSTTNGVLRVTNNASTPDYGYAWTSFPTTVGKTYCVTARRIASAAYNVSNINIGTSAEAHQIYNIVSNADANKSFTFTATTATTYIGLNAQGNTLSGWTEYDDISVKELLGYYTDQNYLQFDGVDDFLLTYYIDFTATDKVSLFAGVRKLNDATTAALCEFSNNSTSKNGTFSFFVPTVPNAQYQFGSKGGTSAVYASSPIKAYPAPHSAVLTGFGSPTQNIARLRVNGIQVADVRTDQGLGVYNYYPLYIGRRGGTSLPFNGHLYSLIGIGRLTSASETKALEEVIAKNVGVTLNV